MHEHTPPHIYTHIQTHVEAQAQAQAQVQGHIQGLKPETRRGTATRGLGRERT